jgi:nucleotide-binding universal stress UspA family protein
MNRLRRILCPIDFSDVSRHALDHAVALARWCKARVTVLYACELRTPAFGTAYVGPEALEPVVLTEIERQELLDRLDEYVAPDRDASGVEIDTILDETVDVASSVLRYASSLHADLIVLGTHGRSGFERLMLGSVAEKVLRKSCCPVMTVPPRITEALPRRTDSMQRIVCGVDFSPSSARALEYAASLARESGARLTAVHVIDVPSGAADLSGLAEFRTALFHDAHRKLADMIKTDVPHDVSVDELILVGRIYREILRVAMEQQADLIVLGVHGRGMVDQAFFGSTANHVVREATCPVMTLRANR